VYILKVKYAKQFNKYLLVTYKNRRYSLKCENTACLKNDTIFIYWTTHVATRQNHPFCRENNKTSIRRKRSAFFKEERWHFFRCGAQFI